MDCLSCGKHIPAESVFCLFCGTQIKPEMATVASQRPLQRQAALFYPNLIGLIYLRELQILLGRSDFDRLLTAAHMDHWRPSDTPSNIKREFPFANVAALAQATETIYGASRARTLDLACGHALFTTSMREFGPLLTLFTTVSRVLPISWRISMLVKAMARIFDRFSDQPTRVEKRAGRLFYIVEKCAVCWGRQSDRPCCHVTQGMLAAAAELATRGAAVRIEEIECRGAGGKTCTFVIERPETLRAL